MIEVKATPKFMRLAKKSMTPEATQALIDTLALEPIKGDLISGTGGIESCAGLLEKVWESVAVCE